MKAQQLDTLKIKLLKRSTIEQRPFAAIFEPSESINFEKYCFSFSVFLKRVS